MAENIIALMFPEYKDTENTVTSANWTTDDLYNDETLVEQIKETGAFVDFFSDEECEIIYDSKNINAYLYAAEKLPKYYPSRASCMRHILKNMKDWRKNRISSEKDEYKILYETVKDEIRSEIATHIKTRPSDSYIIATNLFRENKSWTLENGDSKYVVESIPMNIVDVFDWLSEHHKPVRVYEWNEKHGVNGKGAHGDNKGNEVSDLLCSIEHAEGLLQKAIGEKMYDWLYCFDEEYNRYMEYPAGCKYKNLPANVTERKYHSYHIEDKQRIPNRVVKKIDILKKLRAKQ